MEDYSDIEKDEIISFESTWMDAEGIMLRKVRKRQSVVLNCRMLNNLFFKI